MALRLSKVLGRSPEGWLKLQLQYDLWITQQSVDLKISDELRLHKHLTKAWDNDGIKMDGLYFAP
jgi:plasmid maintenance system antidote protein VapI